MTDKQIIIDGVDVSGCGYYMDNGECISEAVYSDYCKVCSNCKYKLEQQLKRKEQEYEELRKYHNKCCEEFEKEKKEWLEKYNQILRGFYNGDYCNTEHCSLLKAKEQECEELKKDGERWKSNFNGKVSAIEELLQQLEAYKMEAEEGKEINAELKAENDELKKKCNIYTCGICGNKEDCNKLYKTLTEIKEIAESEMDSKEFMAIQCMLNGNVDNKNKILKQILQKISECEVEQ